MRVVCPKCELKGQIDATPTGVKTRIACVRCATTFDAVFVDGEIQALLPQSRHAGATIESVGDDVSEAEAEFVSAPETIDANQPDAPLEIEASPVVADEFFKSSPDDEFFKSSPDLAFEQNVEIAQDAPQEIFDELTPPRVEMPVQETTNDGAASVAAASSLKSDGAGKINRPPSDAYGMGVRLMRVSPVWLLLAGLSFISFIVFCNWLIKPTEQTADAASLIAAADNHATNQSPKRATVAASTAQSPVNSQAGQTPNEPGVAFIAAEAKVASSPVPAPSVAPVEAKPAVEEKAAIPASASNGAGESKEGKVTIQIGSYNAAAEAEARVANLKSAGFEARSVEVEIPKRGTWYRVQSGRFASRDEAERYGRQLRDKGVVSSFITTDVQK